MPNRLARMLEKEVGCTVIALNPGDHLEKAGLRSGEEDGQGGRAEDSEVDTPEEEQCSIPLPSEALYDEAFTYVSGL
jgi:hypothetical protein